MKSQKKFNTKVRLFYFKIQINLAKSYIKQKFYKEKFHLPLTRWPSSIFFFLDCFVSCEVQSSKTPQNFPAKWKWLFTSPSAALFITTAHAYFLRPRSALIFLRQSKISPRALLRHDALKTCCWCVLEKKRENIFWKLGKRRTPTHIQIVFK